MVTFWLVFTNVWTKGPSRLLKDPGPKRHPNILWKEESKEIKDFMKVEDGNVHYKRYDGHCTKQQIKIPKAIWTSSILRRRFTCRRMMWKLWYPMEPPGP
jgi:hypothetical protein